jgi:hypothetical protein
VPGWSVPRTSSAEGSVVDSDAAVAEATLATLEVLADIADCALPATSWERVAEIVEAI